MAASTLANSLHPHQLRAALAPSSARQRCLKPQPEFRVFSTGESKHPWRIAAFETNRTISRHKSLNYAIRKCARLNVRPEQTKRDPLQDALSGFRDVNTYRAYYEGVGNDF